MYHATWARPKSSAYYFYVKSGFPKERELSGLKSNIVLEIL